MKLTFFTFFFSILFSTTLLAATPAGLWLAKSPFFNNRPVGVVTITITNGGLCGSLIKILPVNGRTHFSRYSTGLPNSGLIVMCNYRRTASGWEGGQIYEQKSASIYPSKVKLDASGRYLYVTGQSGLASQTATWTRIK